MKKAPKCQEPKEHHPACTCNISSEKLSNAIIENSNLAWLEQSIEYAESLNKKWWLNNQDEKGRYFARGEVNETDVFIIQQIITNLKELKTYNFAERG